MAMPFWIWLYTTILKCVTLAVALIFNCAHKLKANCRKILSAFYDSLQYGGVQRPESYNEAKLRGEKQNELLDKTMAVPNIEEIWESEEVLQIAEEWIKNN